MSMSELMIVGFAVIILFGGKRLPEFARNAGRIIRTLRRQYEQLKREIGLDDFNDLTKK